MSQQSPIHCECHPSLATLTSPFDSSRRTVLSQHIWGSMLAPGDNGSAHLSRHLRWVLLLQCRLCHIPFNEVRKANPGSVSNPNIIFFSFHSNCFTTLIVIFLRSCSVVSTFFCYVNQVATAEELLARAEINGSRVRNTQVNPPTRSADGESTPRERRKNQNRISRNCFSYAREHPMPFPCKVNTVQTSDSTGHLEPEGPKW